MYFVSLQDILKKCEQNVSDHRNYLEKQSDCAQWLIKAKEKFDANADTIGSRSELEEKLEQIQVNTALHLINIFIGLRSEFNNFDCMDVSNEKLIGKLDAVD